MATGNADAITIMLHQAASEVDPQRRKALMAEVERARTGDPQGRAMPGYVPPILEDGSLNPVYDGASNMPPGDMMALSNAVTGPATPSKRSTTTTSKKYPITEGEMDAKFQQFSAANAGLNAVLQAQIGGIKSTAEQVSNAMLDSGTAKESAITKAGEIEAARQQGGADIAAFFRATLGPDDIMVKAEARRQQSQFTMDALKPIIDEADAVRIYDNPLQWLINQATVPQMKTTYNAALKTAQQQAQYMATTHQLVEKQKALDLSVTGQQIKDLAVAKGQAEKFDAVVKASVAMNAANHQIAQITMQQASLLNMEQNAYESWLRMRAHSQSLTEANKEDVKYQATVDKINVQREFVGQPKIEISDFKSMRPEQREYLTKQANLPPGTIGADMGDSFLYLMNEGGLNTIVEKNMPTAKTLSSQMHSTSFNNYKDKLVSTNAKMQNMAPEEQTARALTAFNMEEVKTLSQNREYDKLPDGSPRKVSIGTALQYPELSGNSFLPDIKARLAIKGFQGEVTSRDLEEIAIAKALNDPGKIPQIAQEFSTFYRVAQEQQWVRSGASALGVGRPREFGTSTMTVRGRAINQWSPSEVENWLMQRVVGIPGTPSSFMDTLVPPVTQPGMPATTDIGRAVQQEPFNPKNVRKP